MMDGILRFLTGDSELADRYVREEEANRRGGQGLEGGEERGGSED